MVTMKVGDIEVIGRRERCRVEGVVAREREPRPEVGGREPRITQDGAAPRLEQEADVQVVGESTAAEDLVGEIGRTQPDVVLLDWELPGLRSNGLGLCRQRQAFGARRPHRLHRRGYDAETQCPEHRCRGSEGQFVAPNQLLEAIG